MTIGTTRGRSSARRIVLAAASITFIAGAAAADMSLQQLQRELAKQGYQVTEVRRTWLGRIQVTSSANGMIRETVLTGNGSVLRDVVRQGGGDPATIIERGSTRSSDAGSSSSGGSGGGSSASSSGGGNGNSGGKSSSAGSNSNAGGNGKGNAGGGGRGGGNAGGNGRGNGNSS